MENRKAKSLLRAKLKAKALGKRYKGDVQGQQKRWLEKNRKKKKAHVLVVAAVCSGEIIKPSRCSVCKKECSVLGHHEDYDKPLDVIWMCQQCHNEKHGIKKTKLRKSVEEEIKRLLCDCRLCGYKWMARKNDATNNPIKPVECPKCRRRNWS